ncbi:MAG TPA: cytochrome c maturation protein CcmE [Bacteroidota bacterium]|nr:cytochrome c maturation protein CcmE [Bacteroidota bacterium]
MNIKLLIGGAVIVGAIIFGASSFLQTNVEYADFRTAIDTHKKIQVKGEWQRGQESRFDAGKGQFSFFMKDEAGTVMQVVYDGAKPNNFELATAIVVKGRADGRVFHASEILTKCPSKYEASSPPQKTS